MDIFQLSPSPGADNHLHQMWLSGGYQGLQIVLPELAVPSFDSVLGNFHNLSIFQDNPPQLPRFESTSPVFIPPSWHGDGADAPITLMRADVPKIWRKVSALLIQRQRRSVFSPCCFRLVAGGKKEKVFGFLSCCQSDVRRTERPERRKVPAKSRK